MNENYTPNGPPKKDNSPPWIAIIICFIFFWPLGLILLISKLLNMDKAQRAGQPRVTQQSAPNRAAQSRAQAAQAPRPAYRPAAPQRPAPPRQQAKAPQKAGSQAPAQYPVRSRAALYTSLGVVISFVSVFLLAAAALLAQNPRELPGAVALFVIGGFGVGGSVASFIFGSRWSRRTRRYKRFSAVIGKRDVISVYELGRALGLPADEAREQLVDLIDSGFFGEGAYFDYELMSFVSSYEAAEAMRKKAAQARADSSDDGAARTTNYVAIVNDMHELRYSLTDELIAQRFDRIIDLTVKIFLVLEEHPEKAEQCRRFTTYYLPTTLKLLRSYSALEARGLDDDKSTKQDILRVLDNLIEGFEQQYDRLFSGEKLDLRADIQVLENMLRRDGLTGDEFGQSMPGGCV
ncbi:MAG: hypothetical protein GX189_00455 [Clostridiales bacterium]|nr:hypothetical protein [Clostridiales bacterium]